MSETMLSLSDVLTLIALIGGAIVVVVQLRASSAAGEKKIDELIRDNRDFRRWMKDHERRTSRIELALVRVMENAKMSESGTFNVHIEGEGAG